MRLLSLLSLLCLYFFCATLHAELVAIPAPPAVGAKAWLMMDYHTGKVLAESNSDKQLEPASLTKVMTAYVVLSRLQAGLISLDAEVLISKKAWKMRGSRMFIEVDKKVRVEDLLRGLIIQSGNDAAVALAEYIAETEEKFVGLMNEQAKNLGMFNTQFKNATGWPAEGHYSTASDLMILANALIRDLPEFYGYYSEKSFTYKKITQTNRNHLLWQDPSVDGIKTGHTDASGYSLMSSAKRDDMRLITVLLGAKSAKARIKFTQNLFNFAYRFYETRRLYSAGESLKTVKVWKGREQQVDLVPNEDVYITIPRGLYADLNASMQVAVDIYAPVQQGAMYGEGVVVLKDTELKKFPITAKQSIAKGNLWQRMRDSVLSVF